ncbi:beta-microseminoprotein-like [Patiria miniata]|uniref:Uncharacterized protein n=1 Tax=Patiria miniata TaxID=46514 RepID=A0A914ALA7_PATMI|nr:beta-microseminoprotein-like [Patiria miniata]
MAAFTLVFALSLLFMAGVANTCEVVDGVECSVVGATVKDGLPKSVSGNCFTCICIKYNRATAVQCCSNALMPTGYDESKCELILNEKTCMYAVHEVESPHNGCPFTGYFFPT